MVDLYINCINGRKVATGYGSDHHHTDLDRPRAHPTDATHQRVQKKKERKKTKSTNDEKIDVVFSPTLCFCCIDGNLFMFVWEETGIIYDRTDERRRNILQQ